MVGVPENWEEPLPDETRGGRSDQEEMGHRQEHRRPFSCPFRSSLTFWKAAGP
jgi:hypothetical protein